MVPKSSPDADAGAGASASAAEKHATMAGSTPASVSVPTPKLRSCVICRRRKVRCDKVSPCSNCRRANIACIFPSNDRPPRWARRLERITNEAAGAAPDSPQGADLQSTHVMERLRNLESLVKELSGQLDQANATASSAGGGSGAASAGNSPASTAGSHARDAERGTKTYSTLGNTAPGVQEQFGRMVLKDANRGRYVSSGFWSRVDDELNGLKMDLTGENSDSSEEEYSQGKTPSTQELDRTPSERHAFLFRHNLGISAPSSREFHPLPSQIPFLLNTYAENVNIFVQIVHIPTITKMTREVRRGDMSNLTAANEALLFAIYYAAVTSMEEDDVLDNFGTTKGELNLRYRLGLEYALAKADFLNVPDIVLVQAFVIFLFLVRRHDSPRFVWMMVGIAIRMAQSLGLHRDGSHFKSLTPYDVEIRRRVWWTICMLDVRASEDQGTEYTIPIDSFDTRIPLNIDDADIGPDTKETPLERQAMTDMTFPVDIFKVCELTRRIMSPGNKERAPGLQEQIHLVQGLYNVIEQEYLQNSKEGDNTVWCVGITCVRLTMSKMTLMIHLPLLGPSMDQRASDEIRNKLLVSAIEVAEWNHALNAEQAWRQWRWMYQTYTHWHAIVILLIEIARRPLSPIVERAWIALHSSWLIPAQPDMGKKLQIWIPLRKLMAKARKHREAEVQRLKGGAQGINQLLEEDGNIPAPASSGPFASQESLREHWRSLLDMPAEINGQIHSSASSGSGATSLPSITVQGSASTQQQYLGSTVVVPSHGQPTPFFQTNVEPLYQSYRGSPVLGQQSPSNITVNQRNEQSGPPFGQPDSSSVPQIPTDWTGGQQVDVNCMPWMWADVDTTADVFADVDVNMDVDNETDWLGWLEAAKSMELNQNGVS